MDGYRRRGEGRVIIGLPERLEKTKSALKDREYLISQVRLVLAQRTIFSDQDILNRLEELLEGNNNG